MPRRTISAVAIVVPPQNWINDYLSNYKEADHIEISVQISKDKYRFNRKGFIETIKKHGIKY